MSVAPVVEVSSGRVEGRRADGAVRFFGIPYGAPPCGRLRWRPPEPPQPWPGVLVAATAGPVAPQPPPNPQSVLPGDPTDQDEGCLTLNLWTPALDTGRRPVMVWLHGGGFSSGTGASSLFSGHHLARQADVVVVTLNYRLGALGFLAHPCLLEEGVVGNYGLLDQLAALRWVHDHIALFGGDPGNVTVFGESAGAMSIGCLLASHASSGLFRRAIMQSGPPYTHTLERAFESGHELLGRIGVDRPSRRTLERLPASAFVEAQQAMQAQPPREGELPLPFLPTVDGSLIDHEPRSAICAGASRDVDLVIGTNRDEMAFFALGLSTIASLDRETLLRWVARSAPWVNAAEAVESFEGLRREVGLGSTPWDLWVALLTDVVFWLPSIEVAEGHTAHEGLTYLYQFEWSTPVFGGILGACHGLEIPFVFGTYRTPPISNYVGGEQAGADGLARAMHGAWTCFARDGDPSVEEIGPWQPFDPSQQATMVFGENSRLHLGPRRRELTRWRHMARRPDRSRISKGA